MRGALLGIAIMGVLVVRAARPVTTGEFAAFVVGYGPVDRGGRLVAQRALLLHRRCRLGGAALALGVALVARRAGTTTWADDPLAAAVLGYVVGSFVATLRPNLRVAGTLRRASLTPRRPTTYVSKLALAAHPTLVGIVGVATAVHLTERRWSGAGFSWSGAWPGVLVVTCCAAAGLAAVRILAGRAEPMATPELVEVDRALRSRAIQKLTGWALMVELTVATGVLLSTSSDAATTWVRTAAWGFSLAFAVGVLALGWRQRRTARWWPRQPTLT